MLKTFYENHWLLKLKQTSRKIKMEPTIIQNTSNEVLEYLLCNGKNLL
jgi:hypothetical protein